MRTNTDSIQIVKINFEIAIYNKDFRLADEWADKLSLLYLKEIISDSTYICALEKMMKNESSIFQKEQVEETIKKKREQYTQMNRDWIDVQTARSLYSG